ncbi:N-acetylmuramic acid 6-phosphate etherase [Breznakibacter xylanolyticus]|uniref:N-acetylmuramic acid 6-phosphate etherase n=1 Tax=Breznakibacter xylanolyticus TaxID=990 RepID=A0A2W7N8W5_9BACT|nr:N-acetylmuramic acid 6-phosphate etherase [Breznakibacter xylanolyticus]PZX16845.1 N-acetylmuramic acid 6-phosphate etherase [Breznakibacter xylanolyticus]
MNSLPPTEESSEYAHLDLLSIAEIMDIINAEDARVHAAVRRAFPQIETLIALVVRRLKAGSRLFYIGAGTSGRLGVLDASELPPTFGVPDGLVTGVIAGGDVALRGAVEGAEDDLQAGWRTLMALGAQSGDVVVGIAASGTTPYVMGALSDARRHGLLTGAITANPHSPLTQLVDAPVVVETGPEVIAGSTRLKAGTAQKMVLNMLSTTAMIQLGRVRGNAMVNMQLKNQKLIGRAIRLLMFELGLDAGEATRLLGEHGSVQRILEIYGTKKTGHKDRS